jgi:hypothetical protein
MAVRSLLRAGLVLSLAVLGSGQMAAAQDALTRSDRQGSVAVSLTLTAPPSVGSPISVKLVLDTHSVGLDDIALQQAVAIRGPDGPDVAPTAVEQATGGGHHREALLVFAPLTPGALLRIVVKNVGGVAERTFTWNLEPGQ